MPRMSLALRLRRYKFHLAVVTVLGLFWLNYDSYANMALSSTPHSSLVSSKDTSAQQQQQPQVAIVHDGTGGGTGDSNLQGQSQNAPQDVKQDVNKDVPQDMPRLGTPEAVVDPDSALGAQVMPVDSDPNKLDKVPSGDIAGSPITGAEVLVDAESHVSKESSPFEQQVLSNPLAYFEVLTGGGGASRSNGLGGPPKPEVALPRPEKFPIAPKKMHKLPKKKFTTAKIQATSFPESAYQLDERARRKAFVERVFTVSWNQYKKHAWGKDELRPVSRQGTDPFLGWAATAVDSLDTLQIMGMTSEVELVMDLISQQNFNATYRNYIPMFETTIRYLGGLLSAYDLSTDKSEMLLTKAKQVGEMLLGAFDTPNRMPITYYKWQKEFADIKYRAGTHTLTAEVGSFTVEFARLAQLTGDKRYYDAIARITDLLHEFAPTTKVPGVLPQTLDVSGCYNRKDLGTINVDVLPGSGDQKDQSLGSKLLHNFKRAIIPPTTEAAAPENTAVPEALADPIDLSKQVLVDSISHKWARLECQKDDNLITSSGRGQFTEIYTLGSMSDSATEYFAKAYFLLGGGEPKYKDLYINMAEAVKESLLYRPRVEYNDDILFLGAKIFDNGEKDGVVTTEMSHLVCYAGGMFALGGQLFDRPEDVEIGRKLTKGCVWSYNATRTGVMPETFYVRACPGPYNSTEPCTFDFQEEFEKNMNGNPSPAPEGFEQESMPKTKPIPDIDSPGKTKWSTSGAFDMPRSFLDIHPHYILRPEALESVFYMYRITGDRVWQDYGWNMFKSIAEACKLVESGSGSNDIMGYASVSDVTDDVHPANNHMDNSESFWWAETLKYAYLLFDDPDTYSLNDYVLNTEAHFLSVKK